MSSRLTVACRSDVRYERRHAPPRAVDRGPFRDPVARAPGGPGGEPMSRILFVDDEPSVLAGLRRLLRHHRGTWDTSFESDGRAALQSLAARPAAVIVTDFRMPGMDGGSLLGEVRRQFPDTVRLVLSGHTDEKDLLGVTDLAHQFLTKPCSPDELQ